MRGGEKVLEALCELYPEADIFTHVYDPSAITSEIRKHKVYTTFINKMPRAKTMYQKYLPLMPIALEQLDLRGYDLVISSESGPAKGVITDPGCIHICYCHSPMRYVWDMYPDYREKAGTITRFVMPLLIHYIRIWDQATAARVDHFVANSEFVAQRIQKFWRREATVINPPVATSDMVFNGGKREDFYLIVGQLTNYKRADLAVEAFNCSGKKLIVIGDGEQKKMLQQMAKRNVKVMGRQSDEVIRDHYSRCRALIFPGVEDFGIVPVEAMASGAPVIAYSKGGALETVKDGKTGIFFHHQTLEEINFAINRLDLYLYDAELKAEDIARHARKFDKKVFITRFADLADSLLQGTITNDRKKVVL
jgi:glycosyltransferase involved in cell wall biosynthesis